MEKRRLNTDIGESISKFGSIMKSFELKNRLYRTILRGRGLEFDGYRVYSADDDSSSIDWKASKRADQLLVKQYIEEENLKVVFILDISENMVFGSTEKIKCEYSAEVIAALTKLIMDSGDKFGYILFNDKVREFTNPGKGDKHFGRFIDILTDASIYGNPPNLEGALDFALKYLNKSVSSLVIISDFIKMDEYIEEKLSLISNRFETMAIMIRDPLDRTLPDINGELVVEDPATGQRMLIDPNMAKKSYEKYAIEQENLAKNIFRKERIDMIQLTTDKSFVTGLASFLKGRVKSVKRNISL